MAQNSVLHWCVCLIKLPTIHRLKRKGCPWLTLTRGDRPILAAQLSATLPSSLGFVQDAGAWDGSLHSLANLDSSGKGVPKSCLD